MEKAKLAENLAGLLDLAEHKGVDVRPTLLRVLTDLYVQKNRHTAQEEHQYSELALRLIELVDVPTRATVADKLAAYPAAPLPVISRLAHDVPAVAAPVQRQSTQLAEDELQAIAGARSQGHAAMIATRAGASAKELSELFFFSTAAERRLILRNLDYAAARPNASARTADAAAIDRLEKIALARQPDQFARELAQLIDITSEQALRMVRDGSGEPVVVVAKALGLPAQVLQRILLFLNPAIGESVARVYDLAALFDEITREAAEVMVLIWREARSTRTGAHQPLHYDDGDGRAVAATPRPQALPSLPARRRA